MMEDLYIVKIGGDVLENTEAMKALTEDLCQLNGKLMVIHGGGKMAGALAEKLGYRQTMVEGRRVTDSGTLDVTIMVYGGLVNKNLVAAFQAIGKNAIGLSGADLNMIRSVRRPAGNVDFGYVGDPYPELVNVSNLTALLNMNFLPVFCPLTWDGDGQLLNTNADTIASVLAMALSSEYSVNLIYCFGKEGVLSDPEDDDSVVKVMDKEIYGQLKSKGVLNDGILPKLDNAFSAASEACAVRICSHYKILEAAKGRAGTLILAS